VLGLDMDGTVTFANPRACLLLDIDYEDLIACDIQRFMIADSGSKSTRPQKILELLGIEAKNSYDFFNWRTAKDEAFVIEYSCEATVNKNAERTGAVLLFRNVTQERGNEERVQYLANHDDLTGLANRANFHEVLKNAVARRRNSRSLAVAIVDTDHFAVINEKYGQQVGDELLKQIATRLKSSIREGDHVARLHSDQFAIMLADLNIAEDAAMVAEQIIKEASAPMLFNLEEITTSTSVGIAILGEGEKDAEELISRAISALDNAKAEGRNTYRFFNPDMQEKVEEKKRVQILLRNAAENDEFTMVYQPIVDVKLGKIYSSEALIRWTRAGEEPIRPDIFIPIAEESGQINSIGAWVLSTVSKQVKNWSDDLGVCPSIALNISTKQLKDSVFREHFIEMLRVYDIPVHVVELELTETGVMEDEDKCFEELIELHKLGVKLSMDDFGTGYSSLDYLRRLPLDILKIDQSFTRGIGVSENDEEIVRVMIRMAHAMGLRVICEGCETKAHLDFLIEHDCDLVQGYYFSRPKSVQDITALFIAERDGKINIMDGDAS
jgi:diguanylate cyclase (GGDEF)-like protein